MISDIRLALRSLTRSPGYLAAAVVTIGLSMAANGAIFGAVYAVLLKRLPILNPERLVVGRETNPLRNQAEDISLSSSSRSTRWPSGGRRNRFGKLRS